MDDRIFCCRADEEFEDFGREALCVFVAHVRIQDVIKVRLGLSEYGEEALEVR